MVNKIADKSRSRSKKTKDVRLDFKRIELIVQKIQMPTALVQARKVDG